MSYPIRYAVLPRGEWNGLQTVAETSGASVLSHAETREAVEAMTGRGHVLAIPSVARKLRAENGRAYIAPRPGRIGAIVERIG